jgi:hypothetical protein
MTMNPIIVFFTVWFSVSVLVVATGIIRNIA